MKKLESGDDINAFHCGDSDWEKEIVAFLVEDALNQQKKGLSATWLCVQGIEIAGYTSLVASTLKIEHSSKWKALLNIGEIKRDLIPSGLIAQFGVAERYKRQGIGKWMVSFIRGAALKSEFGIKLLTLHVNNNNIAGKYFWDSMGFTKFEPESGSKYSYMIHDLYNG